MKNRNTYTTIRINCKNNYYRLNEPIAMKFVNTKGI